MSFDLTIYTQAVPADLAARWQSALRELGINATPDIPSDWETHGTWYLLDRPTDKREDSLAVHVRKLEPGDVDEEFEDADARSLLSAMKYEASMSTALGAGAFALMFAGALAKATHGVVSDPQGAAFESHYDAAVAPTRGPRGPAGAPTLAERGLYGTPLAWAVAKAARDHERSRGGKSPPAKSSGLSLTGWGGVLLAIFAVGAIVKLTKRKDERR